jgi:plastocyanin
MSSVISRTLAALAFFVMAQPAFAGEMRVTVLDAGGRPVPNAVVTLHFASQPTAPPSFPWAMRVSQRNMQFDPFVLIAPVGASVAFPNFDTQRHHVYSFSEAGPFELRLYGHDETRSVRFRNVGVIAIGCNIHDSMNAFIYVVATPFAIKTGPDGVAVLSGLPSGAATLRVWHAYMRTPNNIVDRAVTVPDANSVQAFQVRLRPPPNVSHSY